MAGNEGVKPNPNPDRQTQQNPEYSLTIEGRQFGIENPTFTRMYSVVGPISHLMSTHERADDMTEEEFIVKYGEREYGFRTFTQIEGNLTFQGDGGGFDIPFKKGVGWSGVTYFDGVVETLEDVAKDPRRARTAEWMKKKGTDRIISVRANIAQSDIGLMGHFSTFAFKPEDRVLTPGHTKPVIDIRSKAS